MKKQVVYRYKDQQIKAVVDRDDEIEIPDKGLTDRIGRENIQGFKS